MTPMKGFIVFPLSFSLLPICILSSALHSIAPTQSIVRDGETIVSAGGRFELGFFSPGNSNNRYLGIWYKQVSPVTAVWVANREAPLLDSAGVLNITNQGVLVLLNGMDLIIWSSSVSILAQSPTAELLDSGNFIVRNGNDANPENILWQSFDHPSDTLLPGMKLWWNRVTGVERYLSSWKRIDDPAPGDARVRVNPHRFSQLIMSKGLVHSVSGPWNGIGFGGTPGLEAHPFYKFDFAFNKKEMYYSYQLINSSHISRCVLNQEGMVQQFLWSNPTRGWIPYISITMENCFRYAACGPFARCNINNSPICGCLPGFVPKSPKDWEMADWSQGCIRRTPLDCLSGDGFLKLSGLKLPDTVNYWYDESMKLDKCKVMCLKNCYCTAYANPDVRGGRGCLMWFDDLIDIRESKNGGQEIYIRLAPSELGKKLSLKLKT
ncbi:G-type lectin S-receptor-like serine/threonine-protein kinase At4g27290 [Malania oleifera]|uniref:G-type lectin S-receptor-like serine/threonine-protein kinase At4g27290 n=1 Tax=Malania oleifera TaxID=397392 RepID=UPI0025ADBF4F|nr:G-type lectin S-receptor-like serine/threonine-protein kinase At4g27290 [Malania oleifera]